MRRMVVTAVIEYYTLGVREVARKMKLHTQMQPNRSS